jgi:hypothetical protein
MAGDATNGGAAITERCRPATPALTDVIRKVLLLRRCGTSTATAGRILVDLAAAMTNTWSAST